jgi:hypothetical protein
MQEPIEVTGTIVEIFEEWQNDAKSFKKREIAIETDETFTQSLLIEFKQQKTELLKPFKVGDQVKINVNICGRKWFDPKKEINRYFNSLDGWRIELVKPATEANADPFKEETTDGGDDLPF